MHIAYRALQTTELEIFPSVKMTNYYFAPVSRNFMIKLNEIFKLVYRTANLRSAAL
jgi:hypothetical protein